MVPDPAVRNPTDIIARIASTGLRGSGLYPYTVLGPFLDTGDVLGHEPMGIVKAVGSEVTELAVGDRVVIAFNVSWGEGWMWGCGSALAMRDHPGPPVRDRCVPADQGASRAVRRSVRVSARCAADGVAGVAAAPDTGRWRLMCPSRGRGRDVGSGFG